MLPNCISASGSLTISPDSKQLAVIGSTDYLLSVFETSNLNEILRIDISTTTTTTASSSSSTDLAVKLTYANTIDLNQLCCVTSTNKLLKFDSKTGRLLASISRIHKTTTDCLLTSQDGRFLINSTYKISLENQFN